MGDFVGSLIGVAIAIVVGVALLPVVLNTIDGADMQTHFANNPEVGALADLLPIILIAIVVAGAVMYITSDS